MKRYLAFLRGINISGKNKLSMAQLKTDFEALGFSEVKTYLNSGNVVFSCKESEETALAAQIEQMIKENDSLDIPVFVIAQQKLETLLCHAPDWWGTDDKAVYDNLIFILPPATCAEICDTIGAPKEGLERIEQYGEAIFWSFDRKTYQKTNWWPKTAGAAVRDKLTIRTAGTVRKVCAM